MSTRIRNNTISGTTRTTSIVLEYVKMLREADYSLQVASYANWKLGKSSLISTTCMSLQKVTSKNIDTKITSKHLQQEYSATLTELETQWPWREGERDCGVGHLREHDGSDLVVSNNSRWSHPSQLSPQIYNSSRCHITLADKVPTPVFPRLHPALLPGSPVGVSCQYAVVSV